jgi:hypothetical protein
MSAHLYMRISLAGYRFQNNVHAAIEQLESSPSSGSDLFAIFLSFVGWGETGPLGTPATDWPIVSAPDDGSVWTICWNENWQGKLK